jgi:hypothetical protein
MTQIPQPPPDKPSPQSFEFDSLSWWKRSGVWIVGILAVAVFGLFNQPRSRGRRGGHFQPEAVTNARQIGMALFEFETEYGKFPDASTIEKVREKTGTDMSLGTKSSNDFFRQLLATEIEQRESVFYARISDTQRADGVFTGTKALEKGECGFTYLLGASSQSNPKRPLVITPMIPGTDRFDPKRFDGKAVVLRMDNSVTSLTIDKDGHCLLDGRNLMDPQHPIWQGNAPTIAWPE